jgi:hypothetical protein
MRNIVTGRIFSRSGFGLLVTTIFVTSLLAVSARAQEVFTMQEGESLQAFAERIIPKEHVLAHKPITGTFGPSENNIVVLYRKDTIRGDSPYTGWILIPEKEKAGTYRKENLPPMFEAADLLNIHVISVFTAQADKDVELELFVIYECTPAHPDSSRGYCVYVYDWDGKSFVDRDDVASKLHGLKTAAAVRQKLKTLKK